MGSTFLSLHYHIVFSTGASWHCPRCLAEERWRSAPVPGRSKVASTTRRRFSSPLGTFVAGCARGRAHSGGGSVRMRPFSTKDRHPLIRPEWRPHLHEYLGGTVRGLGGVEDHVHLLVGLRATHCLADFVRELKKASSIWVIKNHDQQFGWQDGYSAFTVSATHLDKVRIYIEGQEQHHRKVSFVDELKQLLEKNNVKYDPKYLL